MAGMSCLTPVIVDLLPESKNLALWRVMRTLPACYCLTGFTLKLFDF